MTYGHPRAGEECNRNRLVRVESWEWFVFKCVTVEKGVCNQPAWVKDEGTVLGKRITVGFNIHIRLRNEKNR